jgi:hypothetical protein
VIHEDSLRKPQIKVVDSDGGVDASLLPAHESAPRPGRAMETLQGLTNDQS